MAKGVKANDISFELLLWRLSQSCSEIRSKNKVKKRTDIHSPGSLAICPFPMAGLEDGWNTKTQ